MAKSAAGATPALSALSRAGVEHTVRAYEHDPSSAVAYGVEAAVALHVEPSRVFKTLIVDADSALAVAVIPVDRTLDLKAVAKALGAKRAAMADALAAERATGYVVGGMSALGQRCRLRTLVDSSALDHHTIYVSAGRRGLEVELSPHDLVRLADARLAAVAR